MKYLNFHCLMLNQKNGLKNGVRTLLLFVKIGIPQLSLFYGKFEKRKKREYYLTKTEYHNFHFLMLNQKTVWRIEVKGDLEKKEAIKAWQRITSEEKPKMLEWIPNNELQILDMPLKLVTKIPNRLKTMAAKVFDVLLKENGVKFRNGKFDMCISTCSNSKKSCQDA